jgi:hypothetical protein
LKKLIKSMSDSGELDDEDALSLVLTCMPQFPWPSSDETTPDGRAALKATFCTNLVEGIEALPRDYVVRIELPELQDVGEYEVRLSESVYLKAKPDVFFDPPPDGEQDEEGARRYWMARALAKHVRQERMQSFFEIHVRGYSHGNAESTLIVQALSLAKRAAFLMMGDGVVSLHYQPSVSRVSLEDVAEHASVPVTIPADVNRLFSRLVLQKEKLGYYAADGAITLLGGTIREPKSNDEWSSAIESKAHYTPRFFEASADPDAKRLSAAMEWYQDSVHGENQTLAYLSACIGLEAILGDSSEGTDNVSTQRLTDRYAFLMGDGHQSRNELKKAYSEVLITRGKLVHARDSRLSKENLGRLDTARDMLWSVIWHELRRMIKRRAAR